MSHKKIIILSSIAVVVLLVTAGAIFMLKSQSNTAQQSPASTAIVFNEIKDVNGLPTFSETPPSDNGWATTSSSADISAGIFSAINANSCSISIVSQQLPYIDKSSADYELSKANAKVILLSEQGAVGDEKNIKIRSTLEDTDFYTVTYNPKIRLTHPEGTTPATSGGATTLQDPYTTLLAVRSIKNPIDASTGETTAKKETGVVVQSDVIPTVVIKYTCPSDVFKADDGFALIKQIKLDFSATNKVDSNATTGK
jgi:hypothetical protein